MLSAIASNTKTSQQFTLKIMLGFLLIFGGTRYFVGCDFEQYLKRYHYYEVNVHYISFLDVITQAESGYLIINYFFNWIGMGYSWVQFTFFAITCLCLYIFSSRYERPMTLITILFPIFVVQLSLSGIRQATAAAILLLAFNAFNDRKRLKTALFVLLASTFHQSALIFLPMSFVAGRELSMFRLALGLLISLPAMLILGQDRAEAYQERYGEGDVESFGALLRVALVAIPCVIFEFQKINFRRLFSKDYVLMRIFSIAGLLMIPMVLISSIAAHRILFYVIPMNAVILMRLPRVLSGSWRLDLVHMMPFVAYGLYIVVWFATSSHAARCYIPYDSYLFK